MNKMLMRLKSNNILRNMCVETTFLKDQIIQPIFISNQVDVKKEIPGIPSNYVMNLNDSISPVLIQDKSDKQSYFVIMPMKI